jgi:hypothetical protein
MDEFSYLSVLISVILGLAVTQILKGFRGLLLSRARIRVYWPVVAWALLLLLVCVQSWWAMFGLRARHDWAFQDFAIVLLQSIVLYMVTGLVFPDLFGEETVDLKQNFYAHRGWFFGLSFFLMIVSVSKDLVLTHHWPGPTNLGFHIGFGLAMISGAVIKSERFHKALVVGALAAFVAYTILLFERLQ